MDRRPIGVIDSGVGGISVLRELIKIMPGEDFIYYGDSANAPYGTKSVEEVRALTVDVVEYLMEKGAKAIVIACNTATSAAVRYLRQKYPSLPLVGIEPALKPATMAFPKGRILVMATPLTLKKEKFQHLLDRFKGDADVRLVPCPGLMEQVEMGHLSGEEVDHLLDELLKEEDPMHADGVVLGCTHYPLLRDTIAAHFGDETVIFDGGEGTAREARRRIKEAGLLNDRTEGGTVTFENSLPSKEKIALCKYLLEM